MNGNRNDRRSFLKQASLLGAGTLTAPALLAAETARKRLSIEEGDIILFQGDSITDAGRDKNNLAANSASGFGGGYAFLAAGELLRKGAGKNLSVYNRGISGNKVFQLAERWDTDCIDLKPTVLSILIGVNDFWHTLTHGYAGGLDTYRKDFAELLARTKDKLPAIRLIIGEPFAVLGQSAVTDAWYPAFNDYRAAAREIAGQVGAVFIPYQEIFDNAAKSAPGVYWTPDGVHPSMAGARLMADAWLKAVKI